MFDDINIFENIDTLEEREPETPSHKVYIQPNVDVWTVSDMLFSMFVAQNADKKFSNIVKNEGHAIANGWKDTFIGDLMIEDCRLRKFERSYFSANFFATIGGTKPYIRIYTLVRNYSGGKLIRWIDFDIMKYISFEDKV